MSDRFRHLDLFSGIGGFALAASWAWGQKHQVVSFCEIDPFCWRILNKHWPDAPVHDDIKTLDGKQYAGTIDILTGGFPCQPFSCAGKRKGADDDRALWPEMLRVISEVRPTWIVGENVAGIINMELETVCLDLENQGYEVQPFIIPACGVGAPHRRFRVWIVAHRSNPGLEDLRREREDAVLQVSDAADTRGNGLQGSKYAETGEGTSDMRRRSPDQNNWDEPWIEAATRLCRVDDGLSGRVDKNRTARLKALGNAIVPQVVYRIMESIRKADAIS